MCVTDWLPGRAEQRCAERAALVFRSSRGAQNVAEEEGFEPSRPFRAWRFSRPLPSTARPPLRRLVYSRRARGCNLGAARERLAHTDRECSAHTDEDSDARLAMRARNRKQIGERWEFSWT